MRMIGPGPLPASAVVKNVACPLIGPVVCADAAEMGIATMPAAAVEARASLPKCRLIFMLSPCSFLAGEYALRA